MYIRDNLITRLPLMLVWLTVIVAFLWLSYNLSLSMQAGLSGQVVPSSPVPVYSSSNGTAIRSIAVSDDGQYVAAGSGDGSVNYFAGNGSLLWNYTTSGPVTYLSVSPDGKHVAGSGDKILYYFSDTGQLLWQYSTTGQVKIVAVSRDGSILATGAKSGTEPLDRFKLYYLTRNGDMVTGSETGMVFERIAMNTDGTYFATTRGLQAIPGFKWVSYYRSDGTEMWRFLDRHILGTYGERFNTTGSSVAIDSDGSFVVIGSRNANLYCISREGNLLWQLATGGPIASVGISEDGKYVVSGSEDGTLYLLGIDGNVLWTNAGNVVTAVAISPDGKYIATGSGNNSVNYYYGNFLLWSHSVP